MNEFSRRGALLVAEQAMAPPPIDSVRQRARRFRRRRRLQAGVAAGAAIAAAAGGLAFVSAGAPSPPPQPLASAGPVQTLPAPATARVPAGQASAPGQPGTWRLASYLSEPASWGRSNGGPPGGPLSCTRAGICYVASEPGGGSSSGPALPLSLLYVSRDDGLSWTAMRMPGGVSFTTALDCPATGDCLAGGEVSGQGVLLASSDGGYRWSYRALPSGDGVIGQLDCPTAATCRALASATGSQTPALGQPVSPTWFLATDDAGTRWRASSFPAGFTTTAAMNALSCLSATDCVVVGQGRGRRNRLGDPPAAVLRTADGGHTWAAASLPGGMTFAQLSFGVGSLTCAGTGTCYALAFAPQRYVPPPQVKIPGGGTTGEVCAYTTKSGQCVPPKYEEDGAAAVSTDGGATWRMLALPADTPEPQLYDVSCASAADCWIAGEQAVTQVIRSGHSVTVNGSSAMILATSDGGAAWTKITFAAGPLAPGQQGDSLMAVGEISCSAVASCVALGVSDQGSYNTPVYTTSGG
jgi:hypothetical protein